MTLHVGEQEKDMSGSDMLTQESTFSLENIQTWKRRLARGLLRVLVIIGALVVTVASFEAYVDQVAWQIPVFVGLYVLLVIAAFSRRVSYQAQVGTLVTLLCGFGVFNLLIFGSNADSYLFLLIAPFMSTLFFGRQRGLATVAVILSLLAVLAWLFVSGRVVVYHQNPTRSADLGGWVTTSLVFLLASVALMYSQDYLFQRLSAAFVQSQDLTQELEEKGKILEQRMAERTANLEAVSFVAREAATIRDVEQLLKATTNLISERFGFYYVGLFLLDEAGEYAVLRAASKGGGQRMLAQGHRMPVGRGIVGTVAAQGEYRIALDVDVDTEFVANPDLPHTRSEVALPLKARERVIGVLDVQSAEPEAFSDENVSILQMLSDQVAVALDNVLLFRQVRESLEMERRLHDQTGREAWARLVRVRSDLSHRYDPNGILPSDQQWREEMKQAMQKGETIVSQTQAEEPGSKTTLTIPLKPRGDLSIGVLDAHAPEGVEWTQDEVAALETLAEQLAVALDSARLYEDSRRRATYQQLTREITDNIRAAASVEEAVQRAVQEMGRALGASELVAHIGTQQDLLSRQTRTEVNQEEESQG
jgi:GAF domain-containing protein